VMLSVNSKSERTNCVHCAQPRSVKLTHRCFHSWPKHPKASP